MNSLEMKVIRLLEQTTKARVYAAIVSLAAVYSTPLNSATEIRKAKTLHTRLLNTVRHPHVNKVSLQDLLDIIEVDHPVLEDLEIGWILEKEMTMAEFMNHHLVAHLSPTVFSSNLEAK